MIKYMRATFRKLQLFTIFSVLYLLVFIEYLEELPQVFFKNLLKATIVVFLCYMIFVSAYRVYEAKQQNFNITQNKYSAFENKIANLIFPIKKTDIPIPSVTANAVLVYDAKNDKKLYGLNENTPLPPASTTKLMTALIALDYFSLDQTLVVPLQCTTFKDTQIVGFEPGETLTIKDLIYAMLISSAGDASCTLAYGVGSYSTYINLMNEKAKELKLENTYFSNPVGFDSPEGNHLSSAYDLYKLTLVALNKPEIKDAVSKSNYTLQTGLVPREVYTTNELLMQIPGSMGVKTGTTSEAGQVFIYGYNPDSSTNIIIIIMGSKDRFEETKQILKWTLDSYRFN